VVLVFLLAGSLAAAAMLAFPGRARAGRPPGAVAAGRGRDRRWTFVALVLLIVGRQLLTVLDNQAPNRRLAAMVGELEHQAFHDELTHLPDRALFRERVAHALQGRQVQVGPASA
jgi:hypothetical protein